MKKRYHLESNMYYKRTLKNNFKNIRTYKGNNVKITKDKIILFMIYKLSNYCKI